MGSEGWKAEAGRRGGKTHHETTINGPDKQQEIHPTHLAQGTHHAPQLL